MLIKVAYGYKQGTLYNINCQTGPLLDAVKKQAYSDITAIIASKESIFAEDADQTNKKIESKSKKLQKLENPLLDEENKNASDKNSNKKRASQEETKDQPKEQFLLQSEEITKEEAKSAIKKTVKKEEVKKGKKAVEEVKELTPEEIKIQKLEAQKEELRTQIADLIKRRDIIADKLKMLQTYQEKYQTLPNNVDFVDPVGARKFLGGRIEDNASSILNNRTTYQLNIIDAENNAVPYDIDGFCIRTIEEDSTHVEEPDPKLKGKPKQKKK